MITRINLVSIYYYTVTIIFLVMKVLKSNLLGTFKCTVLLTIVTALYIASPGLFVYLISPLLTIDICSYLTG